MNTSITWPPRKASADGDLAEQARPGHGVPSQDPDPAAQMPMEAGEAERESGSALAGGGMVAGMATGAAIGGAVAGPLGVVVGATLGGAAGVLGGAMAGATPSPPPTSTTCPTLLTCCASPSGPTKSANVSPDWKWSRMCSVVLPSAWITSVTTPLSRS